MISAVFFDLDGTLLTSEKKINALAREEILRCRKTGVRFFLATARSPRLSQTLGWTQADFDLFDGAIYANGACIAYGDEEEYSLIDARAVKMCVEAVSEFAGVHMSLHTPGEGYAFNFPPDDSMEAGWGLRGARIMPFNEETVLQTSKVLVFYDHLTDASRPLPEALTRNILRDTRGLCRTYITDEGKTLQLSSLEAGKRNAIERIRSRLGLKENELAVFGDDLNDLEMLQAYENSVAMGNGVREIREISKYVTGTNDGDGIAQALRLLVP